MMTQRQGGVSKPPFDGLNLGNHVGDDPKSVAENRFLLEKNLGSHPIYLQQVHGTSVAILDASSRDGIVADACLTNARKLACTIMVADCLPILVCDRSGSWVAAAHAGWRGLLGTEKAGVIESLVLKIRSQPGAGELLDLDQILVWLGPCIGPHEFEVGSDVRTAFIGQKSESEEYFSPLGADKWMADLPGLARSRLRELGINRVFGNDGSDAWCTVRNSSRFFSFRRDRTCGRQAALIWLD